MKSGFLKTTLFIIFAVVIFFLFSFMKTIVQTINDGEEMKSMRVTDPNKDTQ